MLKRLIRELPPQLESLDISANFLLNESICYLIDHLSPRLCYLDISNSCLSKVEVAQITTKVTHHLPRAELVWDNMFPVDLGTDLAYDDYD
jgi:hypothetical protein